MENRGFYFIVEGPDDDRFVRNILFPFVISRYLWVDTYLYARAKPKDICGFVRSLRSTNTAYLFLHDLDLEPCISNRKIKIKNKYKDVDPSLIVVVKEEIESWYLAGLDDRNCKALKVQEYVNTEVISKEKFDAEIPKKFHSSRIDFLLEILKYFSSEQAKTKNPSFAYIINKHLI